MKNLSQTHRCKSNLRRKEEQKVKKMEHYRNAFPASTVHPAGTMHPTACSPAFHAFGFLLQFFVSSYFNPCNSFSFSFFLQFPLL